MPLDSDKDARVAKATAFLKLVWDQEDTCELETDKLLPSMGEKAPACLEQLGTVLSLLDRMASCWWVCREDDHLIEYLCGRLASTGRAALRLTRLGFYDEALVLCRSIGEITNLLHLFEQDRRTFEEWKTSSREDRLREFSPVKIRLRLQGLQASPAISQERYKLLSERAAHVNPATKPQSHNILGLPMAGATLQEEGLLVCLNELAVALSLATAFGALLLDLERDIKNRIVRSATCLAEQIGGTTITNIGDYHRQVLESADARAELERISDALRRLQKDRQWTPFHGEQSETD